MCFCERELSNFFMYLMGEIILLHRTVLHAKPRARPALDTSSTYIVTLSNLNGFSDTKIKQRTER